MSGPEATVPLALYDFLPVLLAGAGCFALARLVRLRAPERAWAAGAGAVLVLSGGLAKAVWKLALAAGWGDWGALEAGLFVLLCPGFALLAWSLAGTLGRRVPLIVPLALVAVAEVAAGTSGSTAPLLAGTVAGATATGVLGILLARRAHDRPAVLLFALQLALAFALVPLAQPPHTVQKQWLEEILNTAGQGAFAAAAVRLVRRRPSPVEHPPSTTVLQGSSR
jgi:hypothetical protein